MVAVLDNVKELTQREEILKRLVEKSRPSGFVTYSDILELLPDVEGDVALLDDLMDSLLEAGIDLIPAPAKVDEVVPVDDAAKDDKPDDDPLAALPEVDDKDERDALLRVLKKDLTSDAGYQAALDTDDVVGLYLKEAGRVPLLTAQEEVMLAKRMEAAVFARARLEEPEIEQIEVLSWSEEQRSARDDIRTAIVRRSTLIRGQARLVISVAKK